MNTQSGPSRNKNEIILSMLSNGYTREKIMAAHPEFEQSDIMNVAEEVLPKRDRFVSLNPSLENLLTNYPRALATWSEDEDSHLKQMRSEGFTIFEISRMLKRQPSAIYARMKELGVIS